VAPPLAPTAELKGEQLFVSQIAEIDRAIAFICARHYLQPADADDFAAQVKLKLIEDDYAILRKFEHRSSFRTYLTVVIQRACLDYRVKAWGKWRPSAEARRRGAIAVLIEQLNVRDGHSLEETFEILRTNHRIAISRKDFDELASRLPVHTRRRFESEEGLEALPSTARPPDEEAASRERQAAAARVAQTLNVEIRRFDDQDRLILNMRFVDGRSIVEIASALGLDQKGLYRRVERLLTELRARLVKAGIDESLMRDLLEDPAAIDAVFRRRSR
jgi:RNA polymerase sigma factor for flagellar operon FliA